MDATDSSTWQQTAPGVFVRPLDEPDMYYATNVKIWESTGHTASAITAHVGLKIRKCQIESSSHLNRFIRNAMGFGWKALRYQCPLLASTIEYDSNHKPVRRVYKSPDAAELEAWMSRTLIFVSDGSTSEEFLARDPPVPEASIIFFPKKGRKLFASKIEFDFLFRSPHDVIDGMATYALLDVFLAAMMDAYDAQEKRADCNLDVIKFGDEDKYLTPPMRYALKLPPASELQFTEQELAAIRHQRAENRANCLGIPFRTGVSIPGKSIRASVAFTTEETKKVLAACKGHSTTVTPAVHAAIALAVRDVQPEGTSPTVGKYVSYVIMNLRKQCRWPYNGPDFATMICHTNSTDSLVVKMAVPASASPFASFPAEFVDVLKQVNNFYDNNAKNIDPLDGVRCFAARTPTWPAAPIEAPDPTTMGQPSVSLSSRGIIDHYIHHRYNRFKVIDPWAVGTELSAGYGVSLATWKGEMCLRAVYNEVYHGQDEVLAFLNTVKELLIKGLGLVE